MMKKGIILKVVGVAAAITLSFMLASAGMAFYAKLGIKTPGSLA
jgi:hypothetical protein